MRAAVWVVIETAGLHSLFISFHSSAPTTRPRWINQNKRNRGSVRRCDRRQHREQLRIRVKLCAASNFFFIAVKVLEKNEKICTSKVRAFTSSFSVSEMRIGTLQSRTAVFVDSYHIHVFGHYHLDSVWGWIYTLPFRGLLIDQFIGRFAIAIGRCSTIGLWHQNGPWWLIMLVVCSPFSLIVSMSLLQRWVLVRLSLLRWSESLFGLSFSQCSWTVVGTPWRTSESFILVLWYVNTIIGLLRPSCTHTIC